jgi:zinc transporter ZupT
MPQFSRLLRRWRFLRVAAITLGVAWLLVLAAYFYYASNGHAEVPSYGAAAVLLLIAAASFLYAWREPGA